MIIFGTISGPAFRSVPACERYCILQLHLTWYEVVLTLTCHTCSAPSFISARICRWETITALEFLPLANAVSFEMFLPLLANTQHDEVPDTPEHCYLFSGWILSRTQVYFRCKNLKVTTIALSHVVLAYIQKSASLISNESFVSLLSVQNQHQTGSFNR